MSEEPMKTAQSGTTILSLMLVASHPTDCAFLIRYVEQQIGGVLYEREQPKVILGELFELVYSLQDERHAMIGTIEEVRKLISEHVPADHEFEIYRRDGYGCGHYRKQRDGSVQSIREWQSCRGLIAILNEHEPPEPRDTAQAICAWKLACAFSKDYTWALWMTIGFEKCVLELQKQGNEVTDQSLAQCSGMQLHICQMYLDIVEQQKQEVV